MSEIRKETYTTDVIIEHSFYCDDCGKFLFTSTEYDDGYYEEPRSFNIQHVKLKGHYCDECGLKRVNDVIVYARNKNFDI